MGDRVDVAEFNHLLGQEAERPAAPACRWAGTRQGNQVGFLLAIEHPRTARDGTADESPLQTAFDEGAANPVDRDGSDIQSEADFLIRPSWPRVAAIGFQEDARP